MSRIAVVDCGMGNLHSVVAGIRRASPAAQAQITADATVITAADKVIFPGDGHFGACMEAIDERGLREPLLQAVQEKPFLGICVGMQVLFAASEEAEAKGLGVVPATVRRLPGGEGLKIPHMGWNQIHHRRRHRWTAGIDEGARFYFVHSYYAPVGDWTLMTTHYGVDCSAVIGGDRWLATQFHPEKSGATGIRLLENFVCQDD